MKWFNKCGSQDVFIEQEILKSRVLISFTCVSANRCSGAWGCNFQRLAANSHSTTTTEIQISAVSDFTRQQNKKKVNRCSQARGVCSVTFNWFYFIFVRNVSGNDFNLIQALTNIKQNAGQLLTHFLFNVITVWAQIYHIHIQIHILTLVFF